MKQRFVFRFSTETINIPVSWHLVRDYGLKINIFNAYINSGEEGNLALELEGSRDEITKGIASVRKMGILAEPIEKHIHIRMENCVDCGACTAVCYPGALTLHHKTRKLEFNPENCTVCELCTSACPLKIIRIGFVE